MEPFAAYWDDLTDPRSGNAGLHDFHEPLMIALCAVLWGGQGAVDMARFAREREGFLRGFLRLANGPPSHGRVGTRTVSVSTDVAWLQDGHQHWTPHSVSRQDARLTDVVHASQSPPTPSRAQAGHSAAGIRAEG